MCGIAGLIRPSGEPVPQEPIAAMVATLRHRGPDGEGLWLSPGVGLGHTRLAIIDLSDASDQPFVDEPAGLAMVFNGEIYNYIELRKELQTLGHTFRSQGDTEVLLRAYEQWGPQCLPRLNGMFAFAIWDTRKRQLFLARDRFGEKPLHIARTPHGFAFASEMKAILAIAPELRVPNPKVLYRYLSRGDLNQDHETFFQGIEALPPSHYLLLDDNGHGTPVRYWEPSAADVPVSRAEAIEGFRHLLFESIRLRLRSDVPVGSSLSGGLDSSSIVSIIHAQKGVRPVRQRTFSARFHSSALDEGRYIQSVTRNVDAETHDTWVEPEAFLQEFNSLQWHQEEPIASSSPFAQWCVMRLARQESTTVLLDGQGADELLAGYDQAHGMFWAHWLRHGRLDRVATEALAYTRRYGIPRSPVVFSGYYVLPDALRDRFAALYRRSGNLAAPELQARFAPAHVETVAPFPDRLRNELVRWQLTTQLPEFLRYADRNSMAHSREVRLPFLDHRLVEYGLGLPPQLLLSNAVTKVILREAMRGIAPSAIIDRRDKLAYSPPQQQWLRGPLREWIASLLADAERRPGVFNTERVAALRATASQGLNSSLIWRIASTEAWLQTMVEKPVSASGLALPAS